MVFSLEKTFTKLSIHPFLIDFILKMDHIVCNFHFSFLLKILHWHHIFPMSKNDLEHNVNQCYYQEYQEHQVVIWGIKWRKKIKIQIVSETFFRGQSCLRKYCPTSLKSVKLDWLQIISYAIWRLTYTFEDIRNELVASFSLSILCKCN